MDRQLGKMEFNVKEETNNIINFIKKYYEESNLGGVVIGISGGKDSAVVSALFTKALGKENVIGITMPCHSKERDVEDAKIISDYFGFELCEVDLTRTFDVMKNSLNIKAFSNDELLDSDINLKPRLRMATLYYLAAAFSKSRKQIYLVAGTGNACEIYVGYFTKGGDGMSDINVLANYKVSEVLKIGEYLKVPREILYKVPSDGLSEQTDEEKLGITYKEIEEYLDGKNVKNASLIENKHRINKHKKGIIHYERE